MVDLSAGKGKNLPKIQCSVPFLLPAARFLSLPHYPPPDEMPAPRNPQHLKTVTRDHLVQPDQFFFQALLSDLVQTWSQTQMQRSRLAHTRRIQDVVFLLSQWTRLHCGPSSALWTETDQLSGLAYEHLYVVEQGGLGPSMARRRLVRLLGLLHFLRDKKILEMKKLCTRDGLRFGCQYAHRRRLCRACVFVVANES